jgi:hypothetical protein
MHLLETEIPIASYWNVMHHKVADIPPERERAILLAEDEPDDLQNLGSNLGKRFSFFPSSTSHSYEKCFSDCSTGPV